MKRRLIAITMMIVMTLASAFAFTGCKAGDNIVTDAKTINVKILKAGYGTSYIYELAKKFEAAFADEGYKVNVLNPSTDLTGTIVAQDIYQGSQVDVYCPGSFSMKTEFEDYGVVVEDISDIYDLAPIKFDGTEETGKTIKQKLQYILPVIEEDVRYEGKFYTIPKAVEGTGMAVNMNVLANYKNNGEYIESYEDLPVTTGELFAISDEMMKNKAIGAAPFTFSGNGNGYCKGTEYTWFYQYEGMDSANEYEGFVDENGKWLDCSQNNCTSTTCNGHAYEVFKKNGLIEMLAATYEMFDPSRQTKGAASQDFKGAQAQLCTDKAAFYGVSGWMLNEQVETYSEEMKNIYFMRIPVISALGPKLDLCGAGHVEKAGECFDDCASCEAILANIIRSFDAELSVDQAKENVNTDLGKQVSTEQVSEVFTSRSFVKNGSGNPTLINAKISDEKKAVAKLFLRMMASDEGAELIAKCTNTVNPFKGDTLANSEYKWTQQTSKIFGDERTTFFLEGSKEYKLALGVVNFVPLLGDTASYKLFEHGLTIFDREKNYQKIDGMGRDDYRTAAVKVVYGGDGTAADDKFGEGVYKYAKNMVETGGWKIV